MWDLLVTILLVFFATLTCFYTAFSVLAVGFLLLKFDTIYISYITVVYKVYKVL